jgi:hypothetical protein
MLWAKGRGMVKFLEGAVDILWHGDVNISFVVVPVKSEATVE